jgi:hypothetical protein
MWVNYAESWELLDPRSTDMSRLLANFVAMEPGSYMDAICDLRELERAVEC